MKVHDHKESLVIEMSDLHFGKKTGTYDVATFYARMNDLGDRLGTIREHLRGYDFDEVILAILGDVVDGQDIYPSQPHHQDITDAVVQADLLSDYLADWIKLQSGIWAAPMRAEAVCGNHGRTSLRAKETSNFDKVAYNQLRDKLGGAVEVNVGEGTNPFFNRFAVKGHEKLLVHGHYFRGLASVPGKVLKWYASRELGGFQSVSYGHFHSFQQTTAGKVECQAIGTLVTNDSYSIEQIGVEADNRWRLYGVSDRHPKTFQYDLYVA